ncbi:MAG: hypothetical protein DAHOPDDO_00613 [Ignavibacteriaceae bacterium]|nr:hypothetical protein [Ignavibacteriaceae bacterium]
MKDKIFDSVLFIGGTFITVFNLSSGFTSFGYFTLSRYAAIGLAIGICMIVFGFLRRNWNKRISKEI